MSSEWQRVRFDKVANFNPARRIKKGVSVPFVEMAALPQGSRDISSADVQHRIAKGAGAHFRNGDTLLARITPCLENGKTAQVRCLQEGEIAEGSTEFIVLSGVDPADSDFVYYLCREPTFRQYAIGRMEGTSGRQRVSWHSIAAYEFDCPPPEARQQVSQLLSALDDRITLLRETNTLLEQIAQTIFKSWFVDFDPVRAKQEGRIPEGMDEETAALFPDSFEESELGMVPRGWMVEMLGNLCSFQKGCSYKGAGLSDDDGAFMFNLGSFNDRRIFATEKIKRYKGEYKDRHAVCAGDLIVANTDMTQERAILGRPLIVPHGYEPGFVSHHVFKGNVTAPKPEAIRIYLFFTFLQQAFRERAVSYATGTTVLALPKDALEGHAMVIPDEKTIDVFADFAASTFAAIENNLDKINILADLRDTLLPRLISGKLRLPEAVEMLGATG